MPFSLPPNKKRTSQRCALFICRMFQGAENPTAGWRSENACVFLRYAPCVALQTLCVVLLFILDFHYAEHALLSPRVHNISRAPLFLTRNINCCAFLCVRYSTNRNHDKNMQRFTFMTNVL